jgi:hypothetical protein
MHGKQVYVKVHIEQFYNYLEDLIALHLGHIRKQKE